MSKLECYAAGWGVNKKNNILVNDYIRLFSCTQVRLWTESSEYFWNEMEIIDTILKLSIELFTYHKIVH